MTFIVATNVIASRPPERRRTGTPHARAKRITYAIKSNILVNPPTGQSFFPNINPGKKIGIKCLCEYNTVRQAYAYPSRIKCNRIERNRDKNIKEFKIEKNTKQAGAELGQAQLKLGLDFNFL